MFNKTKNRIAKLNVLAKFAANTVISADIRAAAEEKIKDLIKKL